MKTNTELFENTKISKAVWQLAIPTMLGMLVMIIYNLADTFFIGQTGDVYQVAAVSLATPIFMLLMGFGNLYGIGASTTISRNLGEGRVDRVKNVAAFAFYAALATGVVIGALTYIFVPQVATILGASGETKVFVEQYMGYLALGAPFIILSGTFGSLVRSEGNAKGAMIGMMIGTVVNIVLDPIFILTMDMGVAGAAIATVIGNICSTIYYIVMIMKSNGNLAIQPKFFKLDTGIMKDIFSIGIPGAMGSILMSIANMFYNGYLAVYGDNAVAAMGIATKATMILVMVIMGFSMGAQPLMGYAYGAKNKERFIGIITYTMKAAVIFGAVIMTVMIVTAPQFVASFIQDSEVIEVGTNMIRAQMSTGFLLGVIFVGMTAIQAMGKAVSALIVSVSRQGLVFIPMVMISNALFGLDGLIWSQPVADLASTVLATIFLLKHLKQMDLVKEEQVAA